jgi:hypothetical protein
MTINIDVHNICDNLLDTLSEYHGDFDSYTTLILTFPSSFLKTWTFRESKHPKWESN